MIVDSKVREFAWGWLFPYTTRGWLNGDIRYAVGGNGPVLINRYNGLMTFCPTCLTPEECVARFEAKLAAAEQSSESR